jgi:hypothetical protein
MFNLAFANAKDIQFEISDCPVQRTSSYEMSGPCPQMGTETKVDKSSDNNMVKSETTINKSSETRPIYSTLPGSLEPIDPFGPTTK